MPLPLRPAGTLLGAAAGVAAVTVLARAVGFGRTAVFAGTVGLDCLGSTYQLVNAVPNVVFEVVAGGALAALVVPVLAGPAQDEDRRVASATASALLTWTLLVLVPVAVAGLLAAPLLVRGLLGPDPACGPAAQTVGTAMLRVFAPQVVLYGVAVVLTGVLQAHRRFLGPAVAPLLSSLVVVAAYLLFAARGAGGLVGLPRDQELVLSVGTTLGVAVLALSLLVPLRGTGLRLRPQLRFPVGTAAQVRRLAVSGLLGVAAQQLALVVALRLAAQSPSAPAVFVVATAVFLLPWAVLAVPVATTAFPALTTAADRPAEYAQVASRALRAVLLLSLGGAAVLVAAALPLARVLAGGGSAGAAGAAGELAEAVRAFAPGLLGYALLALLGRALLARGDARTPGAATVAGWLVVAVSDVALVQGTDLAPATALGLGNAVGMTVAGAVLLRGLRRASPAALAGATRTGLAAAAGAAAVAAVAAGLPAPPDGPLPADAALAALLALLSAGTYVAVVRVADPTALRSLRRG